MVSQVSTVKDLGEEDSNSIAISKASLGEANWEARETTFVMD